MKLNQLSYQLINDGNGLSVELFVDDVSINKLADSDNEAIPFWIFDNELPFLGTDKDSDVRIVGVCVCGEYGCGNTRCRVIKEQDIVIFREFFVDSYTNPRNIEFKFSSENYNSVISEIIKEVREFKDKSE